MSVKSPLIKTVANIISGPLLALSAKMETPINELVSETNLIKLAELFDSDKMNNQGLQKTLEYLVEHRSDEANLDAEEVASVHGWLQVSDESALQAIVDQVIATNEKQVVEYRSGKTQLIGYFVGQCMKESRGAGNPKKFTELLSKSLS
ncbi:MAG: hypothetical protein OHK0017_04690 [Patescibacteria group bacterium]